jgi:hypothetical protein
VVENNLPIILSLYKVRCKLVKRIINQGVEKLTDSGCTTDMKYKLEVNLEDKDVFIKNIEYIKIYLNKLFKNTDKIEWIHYTAGRPDGIPEWEVRNENGNIDLVCYFKCRSTTNYKLTQPL